jgi:hypothetical protein
LLEGDIDQGRRGYERAAELSSESGDHSFADVIRQKMHLELARAFHRTGHMEEARREVNIGLAVKGRGVYKRDLEMLAQQLM